MIHTFDLKNHELCNMPYAYKHCMFTDNEIEQIRNIGDSLEFTNIKLYGGDQSRVNGQGAHFVKTPETEWVYDKLARIIQVLNSKYFNYDLTGFHENFYYHCYDGSLNHEFGWHFDMGYQTAAPRKLSLVLQLSDPSEYEGGTLELQREGSNVVSVKKDKGLIVAFPSYNAHRVTPVTKGLRRVLVAFAAGPNFR